MVIKTIKETFLRSTCHGFPNLIQSQNIFFKILWITTLLAFSGLCTFMIIKEFITFFEYNINTHSKKIYEIPTEFPVVTICNRNMFTTNESFEFAKNILKKYNMTLEDYFFNKRDFDLKSASMIKKYPDSFRKSLSLPLNQFILSCNYDDENCSKPNDFVWLYDKNFGNCYKFGIAKEAYYPSKYNGLRLWLNLSIFQELVRFSENMGAVIILDNGSTEIDCPIGFETNIVINRINSKHLTHPYDSCQFDKVWPTQFKTELYEMFLRNGLAYTQRDCIEMCYQRLAISQCDCLDRQSMNISSHDYCFEDKDIKCLINAYKRFKLKQNSYVFNVCLPSCPLECTSRDFQFTSSFSQITSNNVSTAKINIYYESLSYLELIETEAMTIIDLISSIGGIMGLFLGISFMSFMEFVEMIFKIIFILVKKSKNI
jgi:hypothetical protein